MRRPRFPLAPVTLLFLALSLPSACEQADTDGEDASAEATDADTVAAGVPAEAGVVEVGAVDYAFRAPRQIPSGWTTFRLRNEGAEDHLLVLWKMPEGRGVEDYRRGVVDPFSAAYDSLMAGSVDEEGFWGLFGQGVAEWSGEIVPMGGPGLIAPGEVAVTTVELEPGTYVMECYVKAPDGEWHTNLGMLSEIVVTEETTGATPPEANAELTLTNAGIRSEGRVSPGTNVVAVHYAEHPEAGLGNDVHLARLEEGDTVEDAVAWTDWTTAAGLRAPSPVRFLGGAQEMPVGRTSYVTVDMEPGRYVWLSEATEMDGLVEAFTVE